MSSTQTVVSELISSLKQQRDELQLKMHLASQDLRDQWHGLNDRFMRLKDEYEPVAQAVDETAEDVLDSLKSVGEELSAGFTRILDSLCRKLAN